MTAPIRRTPRSTAPAFFRGKAPWAANNRTPQGLIDGVDNNFTLAARASIVISEEDDSTFGFNSDDGVLGALSKSPSFVGGLGYPNVEFLTWEVGGGAFAEVFAARGAKTSVDDSFRLLTPGLFATQPTLVITRPAINQVRITWTPATGSLERAANVTGPWSLVTGATNSQTIVTTLRPSSSAWCSKGEVSSWWIAKFQSSCNRAKAEASGQDGPGL